MIWSGYFGTEEPKLMSTGNQGFVAVRRGLLDHAERGDLPPMYFSIYLILILLADAATGVVWASASGIASRFGYAPRYARKILDELKNKGYIKVFSTPGRHSNTSNFGQ